eukprot:g31037.t1
MRGVTSKGFSTVPIHFVWLWSEVSFSEPKHAYQYSYGETYQIPLNHERGAFGYSDDLDPESPVNVFAPHGNHLGLYRFSIFTLRWEVWRTYARDPATDSPGVRRGASTLALWSLLLCLRRWSSEMAVQAIPWTMRSS